jgi:hypothetical protein
MFDAARHWLLTVRTQAAPSGRLAAPEFTKERTGADAAGNPKFLQKGLRSSARHGDF